MNVDDTLAERGARYGDFEGHALITQSIKNAMQASPKWPVLADDQKEALEMVAHKIGRILNGDPDFLDSWHDIVGYVRLVEQRLEKAANDNSPPGVARALDDLSPAELDWLLAFAKTGEMRVPPESAIKKGLVTERAHAYTDDWRASTTWAATPLTYSLAAAARLRYPEEFTVAG
jgi:hypothetical protein